MKNVFDIRHGKNLVFAECYPESFFYKKRLPRLSERDGQPHLIFIGMDVQDIFSQIKEIVRRKIHVHVCDTEDASRLKYNTGFLHTFRKFDYSQLFDGTFATFMTQFDACLVTYNFEKASALERFHNSIPSRFSIALTAGIPIIMPRGYLKGCEEIIKENLIGFTYASYDELKNKLLNEELMGYIKKNVPQKVKQFTLENRFEIIDRFLKRILEI